MNMKCRRTVCQREGARCQHTQTGDFYCVRCAKGINKHNPGLVALFPDEERCPNCNNVLDNKLNCPQCDRS
jgi:hypothetical protein